MHPRESTFRKLRVVTIATAVGSLSATAVLGVVAYETNPGSSTPGSTAQLPAQAATTLHEHDDDFGVQAPQQPPVAAQPGSGRVVSGGSH